MGPSIKYVTLFLADFDPPSPVTLCHTAQDPQKYVTHLGPPRCFSRPSTKIRTKAPCTNSLNCSWGFVQEGLSGVFGLEGFGREGFCPFLLLSQYICNNRKLNITLNFMFNMYDKKCISVTSHALDTPPPVTNCHTYSDPLERDVLYGRPSLLLLPLLLLL